jgi:hypothetical protein
MAQNSGFWTTTGTATGHQTAGYTQANLSTAMQIIAACSGSEGVAHEYLNQLAGTVTGANTVAINTGAAMVDGKWYINDASADVDIPDAVGVGNTRIDRIVLRADWAGFDVEITRIAGTDAVSPTAPAVTTTSGTTYDIMLYQALVTTAGAVTITDERQWATWDKPETIYWRVLDIDTDVSTGDAKDYFYIPARLTGKIIKSVDVCVHTVSSSGTPTFQLHNATTAADVLSTRVTIDANELTSYTAATPSVVNATYQTVTSGDRLRLDCDVAGTGTQGCDVIIVLEDD